MSKVSRIGKMKEMIRLRMIGKTTMSQKRWSVSKRIWSVEWKNKRRKIENRKEKVKSEQ